ncbi:MAG TPA: thiamine phosphate synthase [Bacillota bacterium]|nr:thiamine phosphate synthase [Bacillota bacterium]HPL53291.1 thiamine phosphate synthase [Bacillota bacterium]
MQDKRLINYSLYLITDRKVLGKKELFESIEAAVKGGVTLVQLREKGISDYDYYLLALKVKELLVKYCVPLIINDRVDIALAVDADGVHLGPEDLPISSAKEIMGSDKIIGASANCVEEAIVFQNQGADYLGIGALFPTKTKSNTENVTLRELKKIKETVHIPVVGIGGINLENASSVKAAGVDGIAVASAVLGSESIFDAAYKLRRI